MSDVLRDLGGLPRPSFVDRVAAELVALSRSIAPTTALAAGRIGVVADTHCDAANLPPGVLVALAGCDAIVHCGDLGDPSVLDALERMAPVVAVRSASDPPADGRRLFNSPHMFRCGETLIGVAARLAEHSVGGLVEVFGTDVDVALCGTTHAAAIEPGDVLVLNPGSPTIPAPGSAASVAVIDVRGKPSARIVPVVDPS